MNTLYPEDLESLSRRAFLRWTSRGLSGLFAALLLDGNLGLERLLGNGTPVRGAALENSQPEKGRVLDNSLAVYSEPSFSSKLVNMYWRDLVLPINAVTIGDREPAHNRVWYRVNDEGYTHSGKMQPVVLRYNEPAPSLPERGMLGEISVPYTDALWDPNRPDRVASRLYFSTVYWAMAIKKDRQGNVWYRVPDDKHKKDYYVEAAHVRLIQPEELFPLSPEVPAKDKRLEVRLNDQMVVAYEGSKPVFMTRMASGGRFIDGDYRTPTGKYSTNRKRPSRHMASGDLAAPSAFDLPGVPWVSYLTLSGISFHGTYWHNDFGKPRSHGCLNLSAQAARWLYCWSSPAVPYREHTYSNIEGTRVDVID
jgi:lipoprotein-anchoring transpeptidase ErfK/SrfK